MMSVVGLFPGCVSLSICFEAGVCSLHEDTPGARRLLAGDSGISTDRGKLPSSESTGLLS